MSNPCSEIERIVRSETILEEHGKKLDSMDNKLDVLIDSVGSVKNNKGFIGGIAATGWMIGALTVDIIKPFIKPIAATLITTIK